MSVIKCGACVDLISGTDSINCYGICGRSFHLSCLSIDNNVYKKTVVECLRKIPNLHWYCDDCYTHSLNGIANTFKDCADMLLQIKKIMASPHTAHALHPASSSHGSDEHANTTQQTLNTESEMLTDSTEPPVTQPPVPLAMLVAASASSASSQTPTSMKRKRVHTPRSTSSKILRTAPPISNPTNANYTPRGNSPSQISAVVTQGPQNTNAIDAKWIYLSGFKPETEIRDIIHHLWSLGVDETINTQCKKLVGKSLAAMRLNFVSFKTLIPSQWLSAILNPSNWPPTIIVREFNDKTNNAKNAKNAKNPPRPNLSTRKTSHMDGKRNPFRLPARNQLGPSRPSSNFHLQQQLLQQQAYRYQPPQQMQQFQSQWTPMQTLPYPPFYYPMMQMY